MVLPKYLFVESQPFVAGRDLASYLWRAPWFLHLNMGVTTISKIHNKTLNTDREAPLQVSDLEDPAKVFPLTHRARPLTWYPAAHRQGVASRDPQAQGESGWGRPPGLVRPPQSSGARSPQAPLLLPHCSREHPQGSARANPAPVSSHTCPEDQSPPPSLAQGQPQARLGGGGVPQAKVISG